MAHVDLAKAEAKSIGGEIARAAALGGIAFAAVLFAGIFVVVGTALFLAEWLLGSIGWGVLHGIIVMTGIAVACVVAALGISPARIGQALVLALLAGGVVALLLAFALPNRLYTTIGDSALPGIEPGVRPLVVGVAVFALVGLLVGVAGALRAPGGAGRAGSIIGGVIGGALIGAISAIDIGPQVGVAIGLTVAYTAWIALMGVDIAQAGVNTETLKARFYPTQTIDTSKETLAWLQSRMPPGTGS